MFKELLAVVFIVLLGWILLALPSPEKEQLPPEREIEKPIYHPGVFTGTGEGFVSEIVVEVEVESTDREPKFYIKDIRVVESEDIEKYFQPAKEKVISEVLEKQRVDVDVVTEATHSRRGLMEAIEDALDKSRQGN